MLPRMRTRSLCTFLLLAAIATLATACNRNQAGGETAVTLAGSTSVQPFAEHWAETYMGQNPGIKITVQGGGSTAGVKAALEGAADIGMCSRELKPDEAAKLKQIVVARDGLTIVVHPSNAVADLTVEQVRSIFAGRIKNWSEVGGADHKMTVVTRENGSGARGAFEELVMNKESIASSALVQDSQGAVRQMVSADAGALGYVSHGVVDASVKPLKIGGVAPTEATLTAGTYPLIRPFLFISKGEPAGAAKAFIDWILSPAGQALAVKEGLIAVQK